MGALSEGPASGVLLWSDRRLQGDEFEAVDVANGSGAADQNLAGGSRFASVC